jgi:hypothetical protein
MIVAVQGSNNFNDYHNVFLRAMRVVLSSIPEGDKEVLIYSAGPKNVNNFVAEFSNKTEDRLKGLGIKIKYFRVPPSWVEQNIDSLNEFIYLSKPNEPKSKLLAAADLSGLDPKWYRY